MYRICLLLSLIALHRNLPAQSLRPPGPGDAPIVQVIDQQVLAWNKADVEGFMAGYWQSDSLLFITSRGPVYGWKQTLDHYRQTYPGSVAMGHLTLDQLLVSPLGEDAYFVVGRWRLERAAGNLGGQFTLLFRKIDGYWRIVVDHTS